MTIETSAAATTGTSWAMRLKVALLHLVVGPPLGLVGFGAVVLAEERLAGRVNTTGMGELLAALPDGLPLAYVAGALPALIVGSLTAPMLLRDRFGIGARLGHIAAAAVVAVVLPLTVDIVLNGPSDPLGLLPSLVRWLTISSIFAAAVTGIVVRLVLRPGR